MVSRPRRPLRITLLLGLVLITTALNIVRLLTAIAWRSALETYLSAEVVFYIGGTGLLWAVVGVFVLWSYSCRRPHTRLIILLAAGLYAGWAWADRLVFQGTARTNWPFALATTIVLLAFTAAVVLDSHHENYFRKETNERKPENPAAT